MKNSPDWEQMQMSHKATLPESFSLHLSVNLNVLNYNADSLLVEMDAFSVHWGFLEAGAVER